MNNDDILGGLNPNDDPMSGFLGGTGFTDDDLDNPLFSQADILRMNLQALGKTDDPKEDDSLPIEDLTKRKPGRPLKAKPEENSEQDLDEDKSLFSEFDKKDDESEPDNAEPDGLDPEEVTVYLDMLDAIWEAAGWDWDEETEKPQTQEELKEYLQDMIARQSVPEFANDELAKLNEFVLNGGSIDEYYGVGNKSEFGAKTLETVDGQRLVVKLLLERQGLSELIIIRKLDKYEDAGILEDESVELLEMLKDLEELDKRQLLESQKKYLEERELNVLAFKSNVLDTVKSIKDIRGILVPEKEKPELLKYMFEIKKNGMTQFQEDYQSNVSNLIESAYFTKNKDKLIDSAKKVGEKSALDRVKTKLKSTTPERGTRQVNRSNDKNIWDFL